MLHAHSDASGPTCARLYGSGVEISKPNSRAKTPDYQRDAGAALRKDGVTYAPGRHRPGSGRVARGAQVGEEDDLANGGLVGEEHHHAVYAPAHTAGGRHAVLQGADVVLVHGVGLLIARFALLFLFQEALSLIEGVV